VVEGAPRLLPAMPEDLSASARRSLESLGVTVLNSSMVTNVDAEGVSLGAKHIPARTVLWAAGVRASSLGKLLADRAGAPIDSAGRIQVSPDLSVPGHPEILITGDLAHIMQDGKLVPGVAPAAMQQGMYAAKAILERVQGKQPAPFHYKDKGNLATIGRNHAVAELGKLHFSGYLAWLLWLFIHLLYIVGFENRLLIAIQWGFEYFTWNRGARLITGQWRLQDRPEYKRPEGSDTAQHNPDRIPLQTRPKS
jgi:NADH dehydrogenase